MSETSEWAKQEARKILGRIAGNVITGWQSENRLRAESATDRATDAIALALDAARAVQPGCVRLPDGREVKVLGTLPMTADGCVIGLGATLWRSHRPETRMWSARHMLVYNDKGNYIGDADGAMGPCYSEDYARTAGAERSKG